MSVRFYRGGRSPRAILLDMTNLQGNLEDNNTNPTTTSTAVLSFETECYDQLLKENITLKKLLSDRNKIVELARVELKNIKGTLQKFQLQNWNLAQSNIQIAAELNSSRGQLKSIHHELACKDALLRSKVPEIQEHREEVVEGSLQEDRLNKKCLLGSVGNDIFQESSENETLQDKQRHGVKRRRSTVFKNNGVGDVENRPSLVDRPSRRAAAEKVKSYRERSVKVKLRREE